MKEIKINIVPCCHFPTETVLVDDNLVFANSLKLELSEDFKTLVFNDPNECLLYLKKKSDLFSALLFNYITNPPDDEDIFRQGKVINVSDLHKIIYDKRRFELTTVVVVDYAMPQLNGRDFSLSIQDMPYLVMMLTGEADSLIAVELFNQGLIHKFISKAHKDYVREVSEEIEKLRLKFFQSIFENSLSTRLLSILNDPVYIEKYNQISRENLIIESYLLDDSGSQLLLDRQGKPFWFLVKTNEELEMFYEFASNDSSADPAVVEKIKNKEVVTHFFDKNDIFTKAKDWEIFPAEKMQGKLLYYWALVKEIPGSHLDTSKIISYDQYLNGLDNEIE